MNWLNILLEEVLNEINSKDAYERFYKSIPYEDYKNIINNQENIDKFMQFFLNAVRDGQMEPHEAAVGLKKINSTDPLVRQNILNKFKAGEYESPYDIIDDASTLGTNGIVSLKKFAKEGYLKIGETEHWILTATINYEANHHYFGKTHWCTASDRAGRYDGYRMFQEYAIDHKSALFQLCRKNTSFENASDGFQIAMNVMGRVTELCDVTDDRWDLGDVKNDCPHSDEIAILIDAMKKNVEKVFSLTLEMAKREGPFQNSRDGIVEKRKQRLLRKIDQENEAHLQKIQQSWEEFLNNKEYLNPNFFDNIENYVLDVSDIEEEDNTDVDTAMKNEQLAEEKRYMVYSKYNDNLICITTILGLENTIDGYFFNTDCTGLDALWLIKDDNKIAYYGVGDIRAIDYNNGNPVYLLVDKNTLTCYIYYKDAMLSSFKYNGDYRNIHNRRAGVIYNGVKCCIYYFTYNDGNGNGSLFGELIIVHKDSKKVIAKMDANGMIHGYGLTIHDGEIYKSNDKTIIIYMSEGYDAQRIMTFMDNFDIDFNLNAFQICSVKNGNLALISGEPNMYSGIEKGFIYDLSNGEYVINDVEDISPHYFETISYNVGEKRIFWDGKEFKRYNKTSRQFISCAKDGGELECDKIAAKNFKAWREGGGYSQETKDQMDKMWNDHYQNHMPNTFDDNEWNRYDKDAKRTDIEKKAEDVLEKDWDRWHRWKQKPENQNKNFNDFFNEMLNSWDDSINDFKDWDDSEVPSNPINESFLKYKSLINRMDNL